MNLELMRDSVPRLLSGLPLTLQLVGLAVAAGLCAAWPLALFRLSGRWWLVGPASLYVFLFRGTPLLVQLFLIYYGLAQFAWLRQTALWPVLREPFWCAVLALALNTAAYGSEIIRGGMLAVPPGQVEAARACGMSGLLLFRRILAPLAIRQALPAYGNEVVLMVKASSLASTVTLMEVTGIAQNIIRTTYAPIEVFLVAGGIYLSINFAVGLLMRRAERWMHPELRRRP